MKTTYLIKEYAVLKKVSYRTVWNWINKDLVKTEKLPSGRVLVVEDLEEENLK